MKVTRKARRTARQLLRLCMVDGPLDPSRVRQVAERRRPARARGSLAVLADFQRMVRLDREAHRAVVESAAPLPDDVRNELAVGPGANVRPGVGDVVHARIPRSSAASGSASAATCLTAACAPGWTRSTPVCESEVRDDHGRSGPGNRSANRRRKGRGGQAERRRRPRNRRRRGQDRRPHRRDAERDARLRQRHHRPRAEPRRNRSRRDHPRRLHAARRRAAKSRRPASCCRCRSAKDCSAAS